MVTFVKIPYNNNDIFIKAQKGYYLCTLHNCYYISYLFAALVLNMLPTYA